MVMCDQSFSTKNNEHIISIPQKKGFWDPHVHGQGTSLLVFDLQRYDRYVFFMVNHFQTGMQSVHICTYFFRWGFSWIKTQQRFGACIKGSDGVYHQRPMVGFVGCHRHIILQAESLSGRKASRFQNRAEKRHCATLGDFSMTCFLQ